MDAISEGLRKLILAGIGAVAATKEKSEVILDELVKKGELTVEQGKVLNEELKHNIKDAIRENVTLHVVTPEDNRGEADGDETDDTADFGGQPDGRAAFRAQGAHRRARKGKRRRRAAGRRRKRDG